MPCFSVGVAHATNTLRQRFQLHLSADEAEQFVETDLIGKSYGSYYTRLKTLAKTTTTTRMRAAGLEVRLV
ncbi:Phosphatidylinositol 4-kinase PIK1 [Escovopsis weberi]|uniref:Phosphatidylinositol 4-kinase PIK1 n=1 Tax=Escovopsis weberi TaxID=150374 RepID=A0A0M8MVM8_ESCWE|nr:Phosphatidylinositol 4-kinase PIK1 [Escovopsis weberi]